MASHSELRPDDAALPLLIASAALSKAESRVTVATGTVIAENADGTQTWIGANGSDDTSGVIRWVGDLSAPGRPLGLSAACSMQCVVVSWDGTLDGGMPPDFAYIEIFARREGNVDDVVSWGRLSSEGMLMSPRYDIGTVFDVYAIAYDDAHDSTGALARNRSEQSDLITVAVEQDADMEQIDAAVEEMSKKADEAGVKAEQVRKDMQSEVDDVRAKIDGLSSAGDRLSGQITDIKGTVNGQQTKLTEFGQKLEGEITRGDTTVKSVSELKQTVTGLSSTVSQTTKTASDALSKATTVEQTANGLKATISKDYQTTVQADGKYSTKAELSATSDSLSSKITQTTKTANGAMDKASSVEQTASGMSVKITEAASAAASAVQTANSLKSTVESNTANITQVGKTADGLVTRTSSIEQNLNGFKSEVSQTYATKTDFDNLSIGGTNLMTGTSSDWSDWHDITPNIANSCVTIGMIAATDGLEAGADYTSQIQIEFADVASSTGHTAKAWTQGVVDGGWTGIFNPFTYGLLPDTAIEDKTYTLSHSNKATEANAANHTFEFAVRCDWFASGRFRWRRAKCEKGSKPTDWSPAPQDQQPAGDYSTKSYVDQKSKSIALGVVRSYKGADGSGLATKSDITVEHERITSEVSGKYATKDGVTEEISSKVSQNNESLDVKFATKVENQSTLDAANTAQSNASDAQSRVGTLEDCISLTSAGVRAGHQANGVFDGVSALVNTGGSFDLLDKDGNLLTRVDRHSLQVAGDDGVGSGHFTLSQDGLDITVQPTANETVTYHIQLGAGGISITAPDGSHVNCSARTGLDLETVKYGKLSIGSGGLQFTNDQGWGLSLSASGWSLKWAGNHTLATGPTAGALYIDGRQIVTK